MQTAPTAGFWLALCLLGYLYAGYPLIAWFRAMSAPISAIILMAIGS